MSPDDPFERLQDHLDAPLQQPSRGRKYYENLAEDRFAKLFEAFANFDSKLNAKGGGLKFDWTRDDSANGIAEGRMDLRFGGRQVGTSDVAFQGQAVWFHAADFRQITAREKENGSWTTNEIDSLISSLSDYIIAKTPRA